MSTFNTNRISFEKSIFMKQSSHFLSSENPNPDKIFENVVDRSRILQHLTTEQRRHIFETLYWPVYNHLHKEKLSFSQANTGKTSKPFFVGLSAPQGCGKTTLTAVLEEMFLSEGMNAISMSLDDFYLTGADQDGVASSFPSNPLLQYRGNAGTHDLKLLHETLNSLRNFSTHSSTNKSVTPEDIPWIPRYDKSLRQGRGDRAPREAWTPIHSPVEVVLFEGWMLGFSPTSDATLLQTIHPGLIDINRFIAQYQDLHDSFDSWLILAVQSPDVVYRWRLQAEHNMKTSGKPSLTDEQVRDFIDRFMPAYHAYLPALYSVGPQRRDKVSALKIQVDENRQPVLFEELRNECPSIASRL